MAQSMRLPPPRLVLHGGTVLVEGVPQGVFRPLFILTYIQNKIKMLEMLYSYFSSRSSRRALLFLHLHVPVCTWLSLLSLLSGPSAQAGKRGTCGLGCQVVLIDTPCRDSAPSGRTGWPVPRKLGLLLRDPGWILSSLLSLPCASSSSSYLTACSLPHPLLVYCYEASGFFFFFFKAPETCSCEPVPGPQTPTVPLSPSTITAPSS